jgi:AraC-like DNA-binding protein
LATLIRSASLTNFPEVARRAGLDPARLLAEFGLPQRCLTDPELKIPIDAVRQLLEVSAERSGVEAFGLMMAETRRLSNLGAVGLLIREQPTLRLAVEAAARYARTLNVALFLTVEDAGSVVVVREELIVGSSGSVRQMTELAIGVFFRILRSFLGSTWRPLRVCFAHDPPRDASAYARVFGCTVEFGHDFNGIVCARKDLDAENPNADPQMARYARQLVESDAEREPSDTTTQIRELVLMLIGTGRCTIELVAQHLGIDRRTVQRHLAAEGETFSSIVDSVRRELTDRYLRNSKRTLAEVSTLLGFSAPSNFSRWYRRQFNATASKQRQFNATASKQRVQRTRPAR